MKLSKLNLSLPKYAAVVACISLFAGLTVYFYISTFTRFILDDFCMAQTLVQHGFWGSQQWWYIHFDGRYAFTFFIHLFVMIGPRLLAFVPLFMGLAFLGLLFANSFMLLKSKTNKNALIASLLLASTVLFMIFKLTPDVSESYYWVTAMTTYFMPFIFLLLGILLINVFMKKKLKPWMYVLVFLTFLVGSGFSETFAVVQAFLLVIGLVLAFYTKPRHKPLVKLLVISLVACVLGTIIMFVAPGNKVRASYFPQRPAILTASNTALNETVKFVGRSAMQHKVAYCSLTILGVLFILLLPKLNLKNKAEKFFAAGAITIVVIWISFVLSIYATSTSPPDRVLIVPMVFMVVFVFFSGMLFGAYLREKTNKWPLLLPIVVCLVVGIAVIFVGTSTILLSREARSYKAFAVDFDVFDQKLRESKVSNTDVIYKKFHVANGHQAAQLEDPNHWINTCIAGAYKLKGFHFTE